jgi:hypothetical protein
LIHGLYLFVISRVGFSKQSSIFLIDLGFTIVTDLKSTPSSDPRDYLLYLKTLICFRLKFVFLGLHVAEIPVGLGSLVVHGLVCFLQYIFLLVTRGFKRFSCPTWDALVWIDI